MPFKSLKQKRFMYSQHPKIAKRWEAEGKGYVKRRKTKRRTNKRGV